MPSVEGVECSPLAAIAMLGDPVVEAMCTVFQGLVNHTRNKTRRRQFLYADTLLKCAKIAQTYFHTIVQAETLLFESSASV